jgi:hypothetical protein
VNDLRTMSLDSDQLDVLCEELRAFEEELLDPMVRRNSARVGELLTEDFEEIGSSGEAWTRNGIAEFLSREDYIPPTMEAFQCRLIADGVALVTYRTVRTDLETGITASVMRSSIWIQESRRWRVRFHQGTKTP